MKYHIFFNFGTQQSMLNTSAIREDPRGKGSKTTTYSTFQATLTTQSKTFNKNTSKAADEVSYFLQLWKCDGVEFVLGC